MFLLLYVNKKKKKIYTGDEIIWGWVFKNFSFDLLMSYFDICSQPFWLKSREYWDESFEERYNQNKRKWPRLPLKVSTIYFVYNRVDLSSNNLTCFLCES